MKLRTVHPAHFVMVVIESSRLVCQSLARSLQHESRSARVTAATTAETALACVAAERPQAVLLATSLPSRSWIGVASKIAVDMPRVRVVLLDDRLRAANLKEAIDLRMAGYRTKDEPLTVVAAALGDVARGVTSFCPESKRLLVSTTGGLCLNPKRKLTLLETLTPRELDVMVKLADGKTVKQCAQALGLSPHTADNYKTRLMRKLGIHKSVDLVRLAIREGLVSE